MNRLTVDTETEGCDSPWIGANHENGGLVSEGLKV